MTFTEVNGITYDEGAVVITIANVPLVGVKSLYYKEHQEFQNHYGLSRYPVARSKGRVTIEASITLYTREIEALQYAVKTQRLQDIAPFDIIVAYVGENFEASLHTLHNCQFTSNIRDITTGGDSKTMFSKLDLIVQRIDWGVANMSM